MVERGSSVFHWADYLVFVLTLMLSASVGIYYTIMDKRRKREDTENFLLAGRRMNIFPVSFSMFVSWVSAISFLGDPVEVYYHGAVYSIIGIGYCLAAVPVAEYFAPKFHRMELFSAYEYFEKRYNKVLKILGSITQGVAEALFCGIVLYAPAIALAQVSGISVLVSTITVGILCTFYTTLGGIKAVLWADTIQTVIMFVGLLVVLGRGCYVVGGVSKVWNIASERGRINFNSLDPNPLVRSTVWTYLIGGFFRLFNSYMYKQKFIQRYSSVKTELHVKRTVYINIPLYAVFVTLYTALGLMMVAYFDGCDPLLSGQIEKPDQMVPLITMELLGFAHGFPGLFLASVFCASLSSMSSIQNSLSINLLKDVVEPIYYHRTGKKISSKAELRLSKLFSIMFGMLFICLALIVMTLKDASVFQICLTVTGCFSGPLAAMFVLGMLTRFVNTLGCIIGCVVGVGISTWWNLGAALADMPPVETLPVNTDLCTNFTLVNTTLPQNGYNISTWPETIPVAQDSDFSVKSLYKLSPLHYSTLGFVTTAIVAIVIGGLSSLLDKSGEKQSEKSPNIDEKEELKSLSEDLLSRA